MNTTFVFVKYQITSLTRGSIMRKYNSYLMMSVSLFTLMMLLIGCDHLSNPIASSTSVEPIARIEVSQSLGKAAAMISQTVQVVDKNTGKPVSGVKIAVCDNNACYLPQSTGTNGSVTFSTRGGVQTIFASRSGYAAFIVTPMMCFASYKISLSPLPSKPKSNSLLSITKAKPTDVLVLAKTLGLVKPLGRFSLKQINTALGYAGVADVTVCVLSPAAGTPPCLVADIVIGVAGSAGFLAVQLGVPESQQFDFYLINFGSPQIIMIPVR